MWGPASSPPPLESGQVHVWRFRLDVDDSRLIACRALLTDGEHERAERFAFDEPCRRFIVARGTLRALLSAYVDIADYEFDAFLEKPMNLKEFRDFVDVALADHD